MVGFKNMKKRRGMTLLLVQDWTRWPSEALQPVLPYDSSEIFQAVSVLHSQHIISEA